MRTPSLLAHALVLTFGLCSTAGAQVDPLLGDAEEADAPSLTSSFYGDFALRQEDTSGFSTRDDIERTRSRLRFGWRLDDAQYSIQLAAKAGVGTDSNRDNRRNLDNEKSNGVGLDQAVFTWHASERWDIALGKDAFPLATTPLTWDSDLRPVGVAFLGRGDLGDFDRWTLTAGSWRGDHLYDDESRIHAIQAGWQWRPGAPFSAELLLGYLEFDHLDRALREGLTRTNRRIGDQLVSDYELANLQGALTWLIDEDPLIARLDLVRNLGADDQRDGARFSVVYGDSRQAGSLELAVAYQRIGRDAVSAAFNQDDWWFHSAARGVMPWVAYGFNDTWRMQLSYFGERLDGADETIDRYLLDLMARW